MPVVATALEAGAIAARRFVFERRVAAQFRAEKLFASHVHDREQAVSGRQHDLQVTETDPDVLGAVLPLIVHHVIVGRGGGNGGSGGSGGGRRVYRGRDGHGHGHGQHSQRRPETVARTHGSCRRTGRLADRSVAAAARRTDSRANGAEQPTGLSCDGPRGMERGRRVPQVAAAAAAISACPHDGGGRRKEDADLRETGRNV